jgi:hypothetical protein
LGLSGVNFWSWDYCRRSLPILWDTIAAFNGFCNPEKDIVDHLVEAINLRIFLDLGILSTDAVHIDAKETIQGHTSLAAWF